MMPVFEHVSLNEAKTSIKVFRRKENYFESYWHFHPEMELTYIVKGDGLRYVGDSIETFYPGDLVLLGKNIPHNWESLDQNSSGGAEAVVIQFSEGIFNNFAEFSVFQSLVQNAKLGIQFKPDKKWLNEIELLCIHPPTFKLIKFFEVLCKLDVQEETRTLSGQGFSFSKFSNKESRVNKVKNYIDSFITSSILLPEVAEHMKMTESYFCRWFKKNTGHTLLQYVNKLKVELVCRELLVTDRNISEIAYDKGFENISHFNRVFKQVKQVSPREYRVKNGYS